MICYAWRGAARSACGFCVLFPDCGFKFGRWLGLIWMEKRLKPVEIPSQMPIKWKEVVENDKNLSSLLDNIPLFDLDKM